jgi:hypothetical protein
MLSRLRAYISKTLTPNLYTAEGFRLTKRQFSVPESTASFHAAKKAITICDLFSNQHKSIDEVAQLLGTSRGAVISALIEEGIILDRRRSQRND